MKAAKPKVSKHRLDALDREVAALQLRQAGLSYQRIADRLGYSNRSGAWHAVRAPAGDGEIGRCTPNGR